MGKNVVAMYLPLGRRVLKKSLLLKKFPEFYGTTPRFKTVSLQPATCSHPEPDQSSPRLPILLLKKIAHEQYRIKHTTMNPYLLFLVRPLKTATDSFLSSLSIDFLFLKWWKFPPAHFFHGITLFKFLWVICVYCKGKNTVPLDDSKCDERATRESLNVVKHYKIY